MKVYLTCALILFLLLSQFTGCNTNDNDERKNTTERIPDYSEKTNQDIPVKLVLDTTAKEEKRIIDLVEKFQSAKSVAFDNNNFSIIKEFLEPKSKIYDALELGVTYFHQVGIRERLVKYSILSTQYDANNDIYQVNVFERVDMKYPQANYCLNDYYWTFFVKKHNENIYISDLTKWEIDEKLKFPLTRLKKIEPKFYKNEKFNMTKVAIDGITKFFDVEHKVVYYSKTVNAYNFCYGPALIELFKNNKERIKIIYDRKITRKIEMSEMSYSEFGLDKGIVDLNLKLDIWENQKHRIEEMKYRVKLIKMDIGVWFINEIDNIPLV